ncbi:YncE family protein [Nocardioides mangrovicus]|uniref:YncE family protein n=1 Tax=Nocardioides mangrovicus TaxID=2478913 RepID=A0A3L8P7W8_9ACTN|nr:YncE family protein [Nocardioides mangrovicus]
MLLVLTGCGSSTQHLGAAEPARAPATTAAPAGTSTSLGSAPQGIVYDPSTHQLAVAVHDPYRLLLLDSRTLAVRRSVPLDGKARHLQIGGGRVLVPVETANQLVQVPLDGGPVVTTRVQRHPHDATIAPNGDVFVGNEFSGSISLVRDGRLVRSVKGPQQPGGVHAFGDQLAVVDVGSFTVSVYTDSLRRVARHSAGAGPTHGVLVGDDHFVVADTRGGDLLLFGLNPLRRLDRVHVGHSPYGMAGDESTGTAWVSLTGSNRLVGYRVDGDRLVRTSSYATVRQPDTVAVAPGGHDLWVTGTADGVIEHIAR